MDCKSPLTKTTWSPDWVLEARTPAFVQGGIGQRFGSNRYFWGNVPALDVLQLGSNEGATYNGPLDLLFAGAPLR